MHKFAATYKQTVHTIKIKFSKTKTAKFHLSEKKTMHVHLAVNNLVQLIAVIIHNDLCR